MTTAAYEVHNPDFNDMTLEQQIEVGLNDWRADGPTGHPYYGHTKAEAEATRERFQQVRALAAQFMAGQPTAADLGFTGSKA